MSNGRFLFALLLCAACNQSNKQRDVAADTSSAPPDTSVSVTLPASKQDSVRIEGAWQPLELRLFRPASSIPFYTYVPADMIGESTSSDEGEAHYFYAKFGGQRNNDAFLLMFIFPAGTAEPDAVEAARAFRDGRKKSNFVVDTELRRHGSRFYYIAEHYPAEYGDGFGTRSRRIQDEWQWLD